MIRYALRTCVVLTGSLLVTAPSFGGNWTTFAHDPARSGWAKEETTLNRDNVSRLRLQWKTHVNNQSYSLSALTTPVVMTKVLSASKVRNIVYLAGITGAVFALDGETGEMLWTRQLKSMATPKKGGFQGTFLCPSGITSTPVIDEERNLLYVLAPDGNLYGLDLSTGKVKYGPITFVAPFAKSWSLNLVQGIVYTTVSLGCGNARSGVYAADVRSPNQIVLRQLFLSNAFTAGIWGRGGPVIGEDGKLYGGTADGDTDPSTGDYSNTVVAVSLDTLSIADYFLPRNFAYLKKLDLDVGSSSPVWFVWKNRRLIAHGFKEGVVYLLDADRLGSQDHRTPLYASPRLGNDNDECCAGPGIWGGLSTSRDDDGQTWLFVPMGGPPSSRAFKFPISNGENPHGSIMAFKVVGDPETQNPILEPAWISGDFRFPDPVIIANGVVFGLSNGENPDQHGDESKRYLNTRPAILKALDSKTGKELYNSGTAMTTWVHFSGLALADGRIYAIDHDSNVYCFGLTNNNLVTRVTRPQSAPDQDQLSTSWIGRAEHQDEFRSVWIKRAALSAISVFLIAIIGIWAAMKEVRREL